MLTPVAHTEHPEVREIVASAHCIQRYRERMPIRTPGADDVVGGLLLALRDADISRVSPPWVSTDLPAPWWAATADLAFPLKPTPRDGRWLAVTCLRRDARR